MKIVSRTILIAITLTSLSVISSLAAEVNPNGFPSGPHYNLNIIGKKDGFTCPAQEYDAYGNPIYGNVVFIPQNGQGIRIYMQSGKKLSNLTELQAIDPCTFDDGKAVIQLPNNAAGYRVYARALAKPTDNPDIGITPDLVMVQDESGNDLVYLGLVTSNGFKTPYAYFQRTTGKSKAVEITGLFEWSGDVCYLTAPADPTGYTEKVLCGLDANGDLIYEDIVPPSEDGLCPEGYLPITAYCRTYTDEWVFNIGDFVEYLWSADNNGVKLLQVRFYPN